MKEASDIKKVERPKSTVVRNYFGTYKVIRRTSKRVDNKIIPVDVEIVGEIKNNKFVEYPHPVPVGQKKKAKQDIIDIKDYGNIALFINNSNNLLASLNDVFDKKAAETLYSMAILRCIYPKVSNNVLNHYFMTSYLSEIFKNVDLSIDSINDLFYTLANNYQQIETFMDKRIKKYKYPNDTFLVRLRRYQKPFAYLKDYYKMIDFSFDYNFFTVYDFATEQPISSFPYKGEWFSNKVLYEYLANDAYFDVLIYLGKNHNDENIEKAVRETANLNYIKEIDVDESWIKDEMFNKNENMMFLPNRTIGHLAGKKFKIDNKFIYVFKDREKHANEYKHLLSNVAFDEKFTARNLIEQMHWFGVIAIESNMDVRLEEIYMLYQQHPKIGKSFNFSKNIEDKIFINPVNYAWKPVNQFILFLAEILNWEIENKLIELKLDQKYSFETLLDYLKTYKKQLKNRGKWESSSIPDYVNELINILKI